MAAPDAAPSSLVSVPNELISIRLSNGTRKTNPENGNTNGLEIARYKHGRRRTIMIAAAVYFFDTSSSEKTNSAKTRRHKIITAIAIDQRACLFE